MEADGRNLPESLSALDLAGHRRGLVRLLQLAYSGEKAAALAYAGHWRSLPQGTARDTIVRIEKEEVEHRQTVGTMLKKLGEKPAFWREVLMGTIGRLAYIGCFFTGWFLPMYFAGKLEHENVREYDVAAVHAHALGMDELLPALRHMSKTEAEHELFFSEQVAGHWALQPARQVFGWDPLPVIEQYRQ